MKYREITITNLTKEVMEMLNEYGDEIVDISKEAVDEVAKEAVKVVKNNAPVDTGKYKKSITQKIAYESLTERRRTIYSNKYAGLTHLLENGHQKFNGFGGPYPGRTRAFPHWIKGEEYAQKELPKRIEQKIKEIK